MKAVFMVLAIWGSVSVAVTAGIIVTGTGWPLFAFIIPGMMTVQSEGNKIEKQGNES